jgi:hypothetical protein
MHLTFRLTFWSAGALAFVVSVLVTGSLFIAENASAATRILVISLVVSAVVAALAAILFGVERQVSRLSKALEVGDVPGASRALRRLRAILLVAGLGALAFLASLTYAIVERIGQGAAVFG